MTSPSEPELRARDLLAVALDVSSIDEARQLVSSLRGVPGWLKIGSELFTTAGPRAIELASKSARIFLDLKFHDIPNTVAHAVRASTRHGVGMMTLHAGGGLGMLRAARDAAGDEAARLGIDPPELVAVTVLTSFSQEELARVGVPSPISDQVARLVDLALEAGIAGVVSSPHEAAQVRQRAGAGFRIVTPGVRPAGGDLGDQVRVATPASAIRAGSSLLVMGRPILQAPDPVAAAEEICREIEGALASL